MNYQKALDYLDSLQKFGIKFGLDRITKLAQEFGNPQLRMKTIHVGGTNGKGSTSTFIASILGKAGYRVGLYLSPYVNDIRERIQINGQMISEKDFAEITSEIKPFADKISASELGEMTEFEVKTMIAFLYLARSGVDFAVYEVGMGGRFDATNILNPHASVITNISLDHTERLGNTVEEIAFEKSGIIKTGSVLITAVSSQRAWEVILKRCRQQGAEVWRVVRKEDEKDASPSADVHIRYTSKPDSISVRGPEFNMFGIKPGLFGKFQHANAATAIAAILALKRYEIHIPEKVIMKGIADAYIPGRLEKLRDKPRLIIDGAHNPDAARNLAVAITENFRYNNLILVIGMLANHSAVGVLGSLAPLADKLIATQSKWFKASPAHELAEQAKRFCNDVEVVDNVPDAVKRALEIADEDDLIVVTGSFYTIGEVPRG